MISKPCPDQIANYIVRVKALFAIGPLFLLSSLLAAEPTHHFEVNIPTHIIAGQQATFTVTSHREDKTQLPNKHTIQFIVSSPMKTEEHQMNLSQGEGDISLTFSEAGDYLLNIVDKNNPDLMLSDSFKVERAPLKSKSESRP